MRRSIAAGRSLGGSSQCADDQVRADVERDARQQNAVIDELRPVPLHRAESRRSWRAARRPWRRLGASGGGRSISAMHEAQRDRQGQDGPQRPVNRIGARASCGEDFSQRAEHVKARARQRRESRIRAPTVTGRCPATRA